ncbi:ribosome small subunit-dependent GTPase A [Tissierella sp. MB52-C2]|uniref:ribosome small subunit-dependent GTPase A n=1 Tax=Tissierella sp. MB52-C2 TaxID=3070999 RepID=UPI00280AA492|nr:ribosome small subunit-dependent GTPase A [Tissierella sp. MB52-C2]WMM26749.1 ribosome small subunit-dependent GTPase A [Tissierella sp. MB52-C2]
MLEGIIVKGIGGFYYVKTKDEIIECRARGVFREENLTPLIGDKVRIRISDEDNTGYIEEIYPRNSQLLRPPVANITQAVIVMSIKKPDINTWLLDRFLLMAEYEKLEVTICLNKSDLDLDNASRLKNIYETAGYKVIMTSAINHIGIEELKEILSGNISVFAGPSGAGKSSLLNGVNKNFKLQTGDVSSKTKRGKHTTRHVELLELDNNTFVLDSPGFSSLNVDFIEEESELREYFREIKKYGEKCRFISCLHGNEPDCEVKNQVEKGNISKERYENYLLFLEEIKKIRRY